MSGEKERQMIDKQKINEQKEFVVELSERLADDEDYNSYWQPKFWELLITINQITHKDLVHIQNQIEPFNKGETND